MSHGVLWSWRVYDRRGEVDTYGELPCWGDPDEQQALAGRWADDKLALLMWAAEPDYEVLAGWRVRVWSDAVGREVSAEADGWLDVLRAGRLARLRDRLDVRPRRAGRHVPGRAPAS